MKEEDRLYIQTYLWKAVALYAEADYKIDKFSNIIFKDKNRVLRNINNLIVNSTEKLEASESEIRDCLIQVYKEKSINSDFIREGTELILILEELKQNKLDNKVNKEGVGEKFSY